MPIYRFLPVVALIAAAPLVAQVSPREAAKNFTLDGVAPTPTPTPTDAASPTPASTPAADAAPTLPAPTLPESAAVSAPTPAPVETPTASATPAVRAAFTLDTPIQDLIADAGAKAVLDKDLPGVSDDQNLDKFKALSLRAFQPMTGGQMTDAMLAKVASDLDLLAGGSGAVTAPVKVGNTKRRKDESR